METILGNMLAEGTGAHYHMCTANVEKVYFLFFVNIVNRLSLHACSKDYTRNAMLLMYITAQLYNYLIFVLRYKLFTNNKYKFIENDDININVD